MNLRIKRVFVLAAILTLPTLTMGKEIRLSDSSSWQYDDAQQIWEAWLNSCQAFRKKKKHSWIRLCNHSDQLAIDSEHIKDFFETKFKLVPIANNNGSSEGVITGYYEPVLQGSLKADNKYQYPVYAKPDNIKIRSLSRQQIESQPEKFSDHILLWTDNPYDLFFLHVQGSGRVQLKNGQQKSLVYAGNNGHEYTSIGKVLINRGEMNKEKVSLQSLKAWLSNNPDQATQVLQQNKRFIYFNLVDTPENESGPRGSLNVPLTPERSIAIDPDYVTLGSPVWLETTLPANDGKTRVFNRLMFAQDTGAAIKGGVRADIFFGQGQQAEYLAGNMNQKGKMYLLVPR